MGFVILNRTDSGAPIAVMDCGWITTLRTAAASAVSMKYLARTDSRVVGIVGLGAQGRGHLEAVKEVMQRIDLVKVYDIDKDTQNKYVKEMGTKVGVEIRGVSSPREVVEDSDIVITATALLLNPTPVVEAAWLKEGITAIPIDGCCYWKPETRRAMDKITADDLAQARYKAELGFFPGGLPHFYCEIGDIVSGKKPGRESDREKIMAMNSGMGLYDVAVGKRIYDLAMERGIGTKLKR